MILSSQTIRALCEGPSAMISPMEERGLQNGMSFGLGPCSYDLRAEILRFSRPSRGPMVFDPGSTILLHTIERMRMPDNIVGLVHPKSSWLRQGVCLEAGLFDPGWIGQPVIQMTNRGNQRFEVYHGDPIAQLVFHLLDRPTDQPYEGKYQEASE
jgi:dCTP deaminase